MAPFANSLRKLLGYNSSGKLPHDGAYNGDRLDSVVASHSGLSSLIRVFADAVMINVSLALGSLVYLVAMLLTPDAAASHLPQQLIRSTLQHSPLLTLLVVTLFFITGFYTFGLSYRTSKFLLIGVNLAIAFLSFVAINRLMRGFIKPLPNLSILISMGFAVVLFVGSRIWSRTWARTRRGDDQIIRKIDKRFRNVLVIGGGGYIGSAFLPMLLEKGHKVTLLDLALFGTEPIQPILGHPRLNFIKGDFRQVDIVVQAMQDIDTVVHLGGIVGNPACALDEKLTIDINVISTRLIMETAKAMGVQRFIFASTCSVYGASTNDSFLTEESALHPVSLYAKSKITSEKLIRSQTWSGMAPVVLRFGTIYGLSGRIRFDLVVNLLTAMAIVDKKITVHGGEQWRPFVHVQDAALALLTCVEAPLEKVAGKTFNVGLSDQNMTIGQVGELIKKVVPEAELITVNSTDDARNYRVSFDKIKKELDYKPVWTVEKGIDQIREAFASNFVEDYRAPFYSNYKFFTDESNTQAISTFWHWVDKYLDEAANVQPAESAQPAEKRRI